MEQVKKSLLWAYYLCWILVVLVAVGAYLLSRSNMLITEPQSITTIKSILIIYVLGSIPFALWYHHREWKKMTEEECEMTNAQKFIRYRTVSLLRLGLIVFGLMACILFCYLMVQRDLLYLALIVAMAMLFCKPSSKQMTAELEALVADNTKSE